jgi:hypothetical protein
LKGEVLSYHVARVDEEMPVISIPPTMRRWKS